QRDRPAGTNVAVQLRRYRDDARGERLVYLDRMGVALHLVLAVSERHVPRFVADEDDVRCLVDTWAEQVEVVQVGLVVDCDRVRSRVDVRHRMPGSAGPGER